MPKKKPKPKSKPKAKKRIVAKAPMCSENVVLGAYDDEPSHPDPLDAQELDAQGNTLDSQMDDWCPRDIF